MVSGRTVVGFSGHRKLADPNAAGEGIRNALDRLVARHCQLAAVSSAASGADTLFIEEVVRRNLPYRLVLPFSKARFERDFSSADWERVLPLIDNAPCVEEIGAKETPEQAYLQTGIKTVDEAQVMVVVWDGKGAAGFGGTADVVDYIRQVGKPLLIVNPVTGTISEERLDQLRTSSTHPTESRGESPHTTVEIPRRALAGAVELGPTDVALQPRRILALDGGGIRGVFTLQILAKIEELFRQKKDDPNLKLSDVFDLIAGTSTGAIIATFLAWGWSVGEIEQVYTARSREMFVPAPWYLRWKTKYQSDAIAGFFRAMFREADGSVATLGSKRLRSCLLVIMRNASTGSPWPLSNNPLAKYSCDPSDPGCNLDIPLWKLLRASTAAPYYFAPQEISFDLKRSRDSLTFSAGDFKSAPAFVRRLMPPSDPVSAFLRSQLSSETKQAVMNHSRSSAASPSLQAALVEGLNAIIMGPSIYDAVRFRDVTLRPCTKRLLALSPKGEDLVRLNWLLIEDAYPLEISRKQEPFLFVDGGVTPYNNPSLIAVLTATLPAYRMGWEATREKLHVTSVGTGTVPGKLPPKVATRIHALDQLKEFPSAMLESVAVEQDMLCRLLGDCLFGPKIDSEIGGLDTTALRWRSDYKFTYVRYDEPFLEAGAKARRLAQAKLDDLKLIPFLQAAGKKYAAENVRLEHLYPRLVGR